MNPVHGSRVEASVLPIGTALDGLAQRGASVRTWLAGRLCQVLGRGEIQGDQTFLLHERRLNSSLLYRTRNHTAHRRGAHEKDSRPLRVRSLAFITDTCAMRP